MTLTFGGLSCTWNAAHFRLKRAGDFYFVFPGEMPNVFDGRIWMRLVLGFKAICVGHKTSRSFILIHEHHWRSTLQARDNLINIMDATRVIFNKNWMINFKQLPKGWRVRDCVVKEKKRFRI